MSADLQDEGKRPEAAPHSRSLLEDELEEWSAKFRELAEAAREAGFTTVTIVAGHDPISHDDWRSQGYCGSYYMAIGAMELYLMDLKGES